MRIGIVGGGIAGLTSALALAKKGVESVVFERAPALEEVGAGIQLSPNAVRALFSLGLSSALNAIASAPRSVKVHDGLTSKLIATMPLGMTAEKRYGAPYYVIHRADLQRLLANACEHEPKITIQLAADVDTVRNGRDGAFVGDERFDLVIGADGVHSSIRRKLFEVVAEPSGLTAWRSTLAMDRRPAAFPTAETKLCIAPDSHLVTYPIAAGRELNAVAILPDKLKPIDGFADWAPELREILQMSDWMAWPLLAVPQMESWLNGRIALIGDAAHAMLPFAAQGGASAIEDAVTIAEYIAAGRDLKLWEMRRKPRVDKIAATARNNRTIYHLAGVAAVARNMVMKRVSPERLLARQDWIFGYDTASAG